MRRNQSNTEGLADAQRMRDSQIQTDLLRIAGVLPSRSLLRHKCPWDETARGDRPYKPAEKLLLMIRDATDTARFHCTKEKQVELAVNVHAFCLTLERYMLEPLAVQEETEILPLLFEETRVQSQNDQVQDMAKAHQTPEALHRVARAAEGQARISTRLAKACWHAASKAGLTLVRSSNVQRGWA